MAILKVAMTYIYIYNMCIYIYIYIYIYIHIGNTYWRNILCVIHAMPHKFVRLSSRAIARDMETREVLGAPFPFGAMSAAKTHCDLLQQIKKMSLQW